VVRALISSLVSGLYSDVFLYDDDAGTQGYLNVGLLSDSNNAGLDFGYSVRDVTNPDFLIIYQGAGEIPGDAFTINRTSAHLTVAVTTTASFYVHRCIVNIITAEYSCAPTGPITFDLTWVTDGLFSISEKVDRTENYVASIIRFKGEYTRVSSTVIGTWGDGFVTENMAGSLLDTKSKESYPDVTLKTNP
jgi:hypothetical protein